MNQDSDLILPVSPPLSRPRSKAGESEAVALQRSSREQHPYVENAALLQPARPAPSLTEPGNITLSPPP